MDPVTEPNITDFENKKFKIVLEVNGRPLTFTGAKIKALTTSSATFIDRVTGKIKFFNDIKILRLEEE